MTTVPKRMRRDVRDPDLDRNELAWWEAHGKLIASVWDFDSYLMCMIRNGYLQRARDFLSDGTSVTVLEPGCGSGGIGQFIAGPDFNIVGFDWSDTMTTIAQRKAKQSSLQDYCTYTSSTMHSCADALNTVNGVLIHSFLHHLDGVELRDFLNTLRAHLRKGSRIWIYEPCFYTSAPTHTLPASVETIRHLDLAEHTLQTIASHIRKWKLIDTSTYDRIVSLFETAAKNGWYLSPKEVPFDIDMFTQLLGDYFLVKDHYWSTIRMYGWLFEPNLITDPQLRHLIISALVPILLEADRHLAADHAFLRHTLVAPDHGFHVWECIVSEEKECQP